MVGIGLPALALLILGAWIDASACLYSGSLSLTNQVKRFKLPWVVTCTAAGRLRSGGLARRDGCSCRFWPSWGVAFPPVAAVNILHTFRSARVDPQAPPPPLRPVALLAWACGSVSGYLTSHDYFTVTGIASIDSIVITAAVWVCGASIIRWRSPAAA